MADDSAWRWRPEPWWVLAGLWWGAVAGFVGGFGLAVLGGLLFGGVGGGLLGAIFGAFVGFLGAILGGIAGLVVGIVLMFLIGRDRDLRTSRVMAGLVTLVVAPAAVAWALWWWGEMGTMIWPSVVAAVLGPPFAVWTANAMPNRPRPVSRARRGQVTRR